ncbi:MAG: HAD family hydrolase [Acidimicrobiales bacterium]|nr:HAD-IB family hydrolase [Actinomycetota bacterium]
MQRASRDQVEQGEPDESPGAENPRPVVAAFDFDGTLTRGGSVWKFLASVRSPVRVAGAAARHLPSLLLGTVSGGPVRDRAKEAVFSELLAGLPEEVFRRRAEAFGLAHYRRHGREDTRRRLEWHKAEGHLLVIVSASPQCYIEPIARELGASGVLATRLEVDAGGKLTGRFEGANCRGRHKAERLVEWWQAELGSPEAAPFVWAYGNSAGDRAMLALADIGINAGRLGRLGKLRRFARLRSLA